MKKKKNIAGKIVIITLILALISFIIYNLYIMYTNIEITNNYEATRTLSTENVETVDKAVENSENIADMLEKTTRKCSRNIKIDKCRWVNIKQYIK